eukprot:3010620-Rhodomonas_salina.1
MLRPATEMKKLRSELVTPPGADALKKICAVPARSGATVNKRLPSVEICGYWENKAGFTMSNTVNVNAAMSSTSDSPLPGNMSNTKPGMTVGGAFV